MLAVAPLLIYLLIIAALPLLAARFWDSNRNKLAVALAAALPTAIYLLACCPGGADSLIGVAREYAAFMTLLGSLFVITAGIYLRGELAGTPAVNAGLLAIGTVLASVIGTTGASALLIRPLLRANAQRRYRRHVVIFFIFLVSNGGGLLTPLGDPPLFLGFLRGVPFAWTSGALSSVLDNAPTYLTFASLATGVVNAGGGQLSVHDLGALAIHPTGRGLLEAVSCGSVFMGAITYIGNGPNFMVKAIAEQHHVRMPSFLGYMLWSLAILLPVLGATALVVFR